MGTCWLDETSLDCTSCGRTLDEIQRWAQMSVAEKLAVLARVGGS